MSRRVTCPACNGFKDCQTCGGSGKIRNPHPPFWAEIDEETGKTTCIECHGTGDCSQCNGNGYIEAYE